MLAGSPRLEDFCFKISYAPLAAKTSSTGLTSKVIYPQERHSCKLFRSRNIYLAHPFVIFLFLFFKLLSNRLVWCLWGKERQKRENELGRDSHSGDIRIQVTEGQGQGHTASFFSPQGCLCQERGEGKGLAVVASRCA